MRSCHRQTLLQKSDLNTYENCLHTMKIIRGQELIPGQHLLLLRDWGIYTWGTPFVY